MQHPTVVRPSLASSRAEALLTGDRLFDLRRVDDTLRGAARGSKRSWYAVELTLGESNSTVLSGRCTCPAGADGKCKHTLALSLAWAREPGRFVKLQNLTERLRARSYEELVSLVVQLVRSHPELETFTLGPLPGGQRVPPSIAHWRAQSDDIFRRHGAAWASFAALSKELDALVQLGDDFDHRGERAHAAALREGVVLSVVANARRFAWPDVRARLRAIVVSCLDRLPGRPNAQRSLSILDAMPIAQPRPRARAHRAANDNATRTTAAPPFEDGPLLSRLSKPTQR